MNTNDVFQNIISSIRYSPFHQLSYISNHKCGSTSIRYSLWVDYDQKNKVKTYRGNDYKIEHSPFLRGKRVIINSGIDDFLNSQFFTAVRNPYSRALSSYLQQVKRQSFMQRALLNIRGILRRRPTSWQKFCKTTGLNPWKRTGFLEFLKALDSVSPELYPSHFQLQTYNIGYDFIPYHFIGKLEHGDALRDFFNHRNIDFLLRSPHKQNTLDKLAKYYGPEEIRLVQKIYRKDFDNFSYGDDAFDLSGGKNVQQPHVDPDILKNLMLPLSKQKDRNHT